MSSLGFPMSKIQGAALLRSKARLVIVASAHTPRDFVGQLPRFVWKISKQVHGSESKVPSERAMHESTRAAS